MNSHGTHFGDQRFGSLLGSYFWIQKIAIKWNPQGSKIMCLPANQRTKIITIGALALVITWVLVMEKSKSFPQYSSSFSGEFGFEDRSNSYNFNGPCQKGNGFATSSDPEMKRKKRIASYNVFTMEGKLKSGVRSSFKWIKSKFSDVRYGM
ncbi:unnamed protein product [Dovyalis caffra]|uniref:Uncharacterized protein n=1 Tax=Dovyalis caffra TaxID=77055 RepID=A0AAV1SA06_9ROSI|nr:unnamed protein product [Dovyalis caffra]